MKNPSSKTIIDSLRKTFERSLAQNKHNDYILEVMHRVTLQALKDLQDKNPFSIADAVYYFFRQDNEQYLYHFTNICKAMNQDPERIRLFLREVCYLMSKEKPVPLKLIKILSGGKL